MKATTILSLARSLISVLFVSSVPGTLALPPQQSSTAPQQSAQSPQVTVPARPDNPAYTGQQGAQQSEIEFVPATRMVTIKLHVEDPNGYFLPNIRRENFAVYEDGVRQKNVTVEVEHAPISVALLMEFGGRYHELHEALGLEVQQTGRQLIDYLGRDDKIAIFRYSGKLETLVDFNQGHDLIDRAFNQLAKPGFSELNFYDALLQTLNRVRELSGRRAVIVISSGLDTFSKATYQQVLEAAQNSGIPIYTIGLARLIQREAATVGSTAPFARIDWNNAEKQVETLAKVSGGRAYLLESDLSIPVIYDDIMENLRLRYVITYVSSNTAPSGPARRIRVELIDLKTGEPLKIRDSNGKVVASRVFVQDSYVPSKASSS
jgi:Ca-activated chloride channel family protein